MDDIRNCALAVEECLRNLNDGELRDLYLLFDHNNYIEETTINFRLGLINNNNDRTSRALLAVFNFQLCANRRATLTLVERELIRRFLQGLPPINTP